MKQRLISPLLALAVLLMAPPPLLLGNVNTELEDKSSDAMRVMTYNIRRDGVEKEEGRKWAARLPLMLDVLKSANPGLIGLQEAKVNQINDLVSDLPQYASFGEGRGASWFGWGEDEHCPILYDKNRYECIASGTFSLNPSNVFTWIFDVQGLGLLPRVCSWGKFKDTETSKVFYLYNTHLDHKFEQAQLNGLKAIKEHIKNQNDNAPVIITGDFNTRLTEKVRGVLEGYTPARELSKNVVGPTDTRTGWNDEELKPIDHIMLSDNAFAVLQYAVLESDKPYPSDHRPVVADVKVEGSLADID